MGPEPTARLTFEEHREVSRELRKTHLRLLELSNLVTDLYGSENLSSLAFRTAAEAVGRLRDQMRHQAANDWPSRLADDV
jgi:hypothetical protein